MKAVIQRVSEAAVRVDGQTVGQIGAGALVLFGVEKGDDQTKLEWMANKTVNLRMFCDAAGKMNQSVLDLQGELLVVSQFTLCADCRSGRRPDFGNSAPADLASELYEQFVLKLKQQVGTVQTGVFGAKMKVSLINDGPVTFLLER